MNPDDLFDNSLERELFADSIFIRSEGDISLLAKALESSVESLSKGTVKEEFLRAYTLKLGGIPIIVNPNIEDGTFVHFQDGVPTVHALQAAEGR